jgi:hypothetical protein
VEILGHADELRGLPGKKKSALAHCLFISTNKSHLFEKTKNLTQRRQDAKGSQRNILIFIIQSKSSANERVILEIALSFDSFEQPILLCVFFASLRLCVRLVL